MASLFKWGRKEETPAVKAVSVSASDAVSPSKVLPRVLAALKHIPSPVLLDLGPVIGSNVSFFGDELACKIKVEDLFAEVEAHTRQGTRAQLPQALPARLRHAPESIDGILCWDLFDYLDKPSAQALAVHLVSLLKPGGVLYGFFGASAVDLTHYTRFIVENPSTFRLRLAPATPTKRYVLVVRDLNRLFEGLLTSESVLLKSSVRETLFRKRA
ncbi:MAG: class I SAM-dependent methyltransferase [Vicinamibacterales bacterium]